MTFTSEFKSQLPSSTDGDQARINQIIYNLVSNAIKFTPKGFVKLSSDFTYTDEQKGIFHLSIEDSGIGIPSNKIEEIFSPFKQVEDYEKRKFEGTGLGLAISKKMISLMGGEIIANSTEGQGSVFKLSIPLQYSIKEVAPIKQKATMTNLKNIHILMAEDNPINQLMAKEMLTQEGAITTVVPNGLEALNALETQNFDIILMDMQMPVMSGYEAMSAIRKNTHTSHYKIIALTAHVNETELKKCLDAGADKYVSKPFEIENLKKVIHNLISN